jgi:predicted transcriptional regulator of viral defense system
MNIRAFVNKQIAHGRCCFSLLDAKKEIWGSKNAVGLAIARLIKKGELASPLRGFYVIVSPEYRKLGCIPADQFLPYLLHYMGRIYYGALTTAAIYYGATHQAPQVYQIMVQKKIKSIQCGGVRINFIINHAIENTPRTNVDTAKSVFTISTAEATAADLLKFIRQSGGLNNIATIISELAERMDAKALKVLLESQDGLVWKQRLGFLLDLVGAKKLAGVVKEYLLAQPKVNYVVLKPGAKKGFAKKNERWKIIENTVIEADI